jgi:hypothetical protein
MNDVVRKYVLRARRCRNSNYIRVKHCLSEPSAARGISAHVYDRVENETVEHRASATRASVGRRRREINREYCCPYLQLVLLYALVQIDQPNRPHRIKIHSIYVLSLTPATRHGISSLICAAHDRHSKHVVFCLC